MAVYTDVSDAELTRFVADYDLGAVLACKGIAEGVENSNFLLHTERGHFILTLYEKRVRADELPFFIALMDHLATRGVTCPTPIPGRDGRALRHLAGKPAAVMSFLDGMWPRRIEPAHCVGVGGVLARLHQAGADFPQRRPNNLSLAGWHDLAAACGARADEVEPGLADAIKAELAVLEQHWPDDLPVGICHGDLFPDNVLFRDQTVTGVIDFYFACTDFLAYDLAVCLNAWGFDGAHHWAPAQGTALVEAYEAVRPLTTPERRALPILARGSALRFHLTRLYDWLNQQPGALVRPKDPREYLIKLRFHQAATGPESYGL